MCWWHGENNIISSISRKETSFDRLKFIEYRTGSFLLGGIISYSSSALAFWCVCGNGQGLDCFNEWSEFEQLLIQDTALNLPEVGNCFYLHLTKVEVVHGSKFRRGKNLAKVEVVHPSKFRRGQNSYGPFLEKLYC